MRTSDRLKAAKAPKLDPKRVITNLIRIFGTGTNQKQWTDQITGALRTGDVGRAVALSVDPPHTAYEDAGSLLRARQVAAFVRKVPWDAPELKPAENALRKFFAVEHRMRRINQRYRAERRVTRERYADLRFRMRFHLQELLGSEPDAFHWWNHCDFGPGASVDVSGSDTSLPRKIEEDGLSVTPLCLPYALQALWANAQVREHFCPSQGGMVCYDRYAWEGTLMKHVRLVSYNEIALVPKTAVIKRVIAKEASLNSFVQKGVDTVLRALLCEVGVDLSDQRRNMLLAMLGSLGDYDDPLCTIDLESASDCNAKELTRDVFPPSWASFLVNISSPAYKIQGVKGVHRYEKLASMGNGVCFPVETLIFWACIRATLEMTRSHPTFAVYGDDIIVRQGAALLLVEHLTFLGFRVNKSKSFLFGDFRESCGADWFRGERVRPYMLDFLPRSERDLMKIHNGLVEAKTVGPVQEWLLKHTPHCPAQPIGWSEMRDGALFLPLDLYMTHWSAKWDKDRQTWNVLLMRDTPVARDAPKSVPIQMYCALRGSPSDEGGLPSVTLRRKTRTRMHREMHPVDSELLDELWGDIASTSQSSFKTVKN